LKVLSSVDTAYFENNLLINSLKKFSNISRNSTYCLLNNIFKWDWLGKNCFIHSFIYSFYYHNACYISSCYIAEQQSRIAFYVLTQLIHLPSYVWIHVRLRYKWSLSSFLFWCAIGAEFFSRTKGSQTRCFCFY
jgi:hypothetical protein